MNNSFAIKVKDLKKTFGDVNAVNGLSFNIEKGKIIALLGPNGAGKTTTINILTTQISSDSGSANIMNFDVKTESKKVRKKIGVTFQETSIDTALTGKQVLSFSGELYGMKRKEIKSRCKMLLDMVELTDAANRKSKTYSGGMKRRLELARSLMNTPEVLILDEPTLGLDPQTRSKIWQYIRELNKNKGMTILMTTHYMDEAEKLADHVYIIDKGTIVKQGVPQELIKDLGNDTIRIKGSGDHSNFEKELISKGYVKTVTVSKGNIIHIGVTSGQTQLPEIFKLAMDNQFNIKEVEIDQPNLGDVFFNVTGKEIKEKKGESR